jgi:hypothetical protein
MSTKSGCDVSPIDVSRSPRLQEILKASHNSYRKQGGISAEEVLKKLREWEAEEAAISKAQD